MAWITKPSGTMQIERRAEPYLTEEMKNDIRGTYLPRYETTKGALLPTLHKLQHTYGWIAPQALTEVADFLDLTPADVIDPASFYEEFWLKPKGRHVIAVCRSIACEFCDHKAITDRCRERLGIEVGETTDDGRFTLIELECLGACGGAPVALVDEKLHEFLTPDAIDEAIDGVQDHAHH